MVVSLLLEQALLTAHRSCSVYLAAHLYSSLSSSSHLAGSLLHPGSPLITDNTD